MAETEARILTDKQRQRQWKKGVHTNADGKLYSLDDMELSHLDRTIKLFKKQNLNTSPLEKERLRRNAVANVEALKKTLDFLKSAERLETDDGQKKRARKARKLLTEYIDQI